VLRINKWKVDILCAGTSLQVSMVTCYGSTNDTRIYRVPEIVLSPAWKCVSLPGCINIQPFLVSVTLQFCLKNLAPPPWKDNQKGRPCTTTHIHTHTHRERERVITKLPNSQQSYKERVKYFRLSFLPNSWNFANSASPFYCLKICFLNMLYCCLLSLFLNRPFIQKSLCIWYIRPFYWIY
jgi:hypothetical protein